MEQNMADREKVIKGLQCCKSPNDHEHCPYNTGVHYNVCTYRLLSDAVELLKEQEPVHIQKREFAHMWFWCCGSCGVAITEGDRFCRMCGMAVKWDEN